MPLQQISVSPLDWVKENVNTRSHNQDWKVQEPVFTTSGQHAPERCASQASTLSNNHDICRICHCEGDSEVPLIAPCYCAGSLRYVHQACLQQWIKSSDIRSCELCKFQFIMQSKIKPFSEWETLEMTGVERRKLLCSVTFHAVALTCVIWSLYVLIDRTAEEMSRGILEWPFWTKLIVVAIGFTGGMVFMYIQCKAYLHLCRRWKAFNRVIFVQNAPEKAPVPPSINTQPPLAREESLLASETCCGVVTSDDGMRGMKLRANEIAVSAAVDSANNELRRKSSSKIKDEEKHTVSLAGGDMAEGSDEMMKGIIIVDSGKVYQPLSVDTAEACGALEVESGSNGGTKVLGSRKFPYEETTLMRDRGLSRNECEEMSHLLQGEDLKCDHLQENQQMSNTVLYFPAPGSRSEDKNSSIVSSSSSEESLQSPSIQLLQQSRKSAALANVAGRQIQQAPTLPARPWTVGSSSTTATWLDDTSSDTTNASSRPKSSLGSQSPLLSVVTGSDENVIPKEQKHKHL